MKKSSFLQNVNIPANILLVMSFIFLNLKAKGLFATAKAALTFTILLLNTGKKSTEDGKKYKGRETK